MIVEKLMDGIYCGLKIYL